MRGAPITWLPLLVLVPGTATAGDDQSPRTPPLWRDASCATLVDRSQMSTLVLDYDVLEDDVKRGNDEPADSRTHQFFAFARLDFAAFATGLPIWITQADIDSAMQADPDLASFFAAYPVGVDDVLETTARFAAQDWLRINADDDRVPITAEQAAMGVVWDVSDVPPGSYAIYGYTWEPQLNLWTTRPGFVKVIADAAHADEVGPAIALQAENTTVEAGALHRLTGCADTSGGSTLTLEWGEFSGVAEPDWRELVVDEPIETGMIALDIVFPDAAGGDGSARQVKLRATLTDPSGRERVTYSPGVYAVLAGPADEGCACAAADGRAPAGWAGLIVLFGLRRRRPGATLRP
ncbi:MAG: hypothetical protein IAG13_12490 [Deltaproteobacteria bacterium]|nr:hypothetical protein [Nannocystaceae bacterium]